MYTVTSQAGFEALVWGCPVVCVGHPWYAGWGLTEDLYVPARRQGLPRRTLAELFAAALGHYCRYVHPATGERIGFEDALAHVELQHAVRRATPSRVAIVEAQSWKRSVYRDFLPGAQLAFVPRSAVGASIDTSWRLLTWGQRMEQACVDRWRALGWRASECPFPSFERLVQHLRALNPRAFIVFRPHPDVVKGLRPGEMEVTSADWCDAQSATRALV
jgi:capsule polysaccharide export protein KpsC/LpsZ